METEAKLRREEEISDNWSYLQWCDTIFNITQKYADINDILEAFLECRKETVIQLVSEAYFDDADALFYYYTQWLFKLNKEWFRDHPVIFDEICKELL